MVGVRAWDEIVWLWVLGLRGGLVVEEGCEIANEHILYMILLVHICFWRI